MKPKLLLPSYFKTIGFFLAGTGSVLWYLFTFLNREIPFLRYENNMLYRGAGTYTDEVYITLCITGLIFIGFSKQQEESETTYALRLNSLYWSVMINCLLTTLFFLVGVFADEIKAIEKLSTICVYLLFYYPFTLLAIFIGRFIYLKYIAKKHAVKLLHFLPNKPYNIIGKIVAVFFVVFAIASQFPVFKISTDMLTVGGMIVQPFFLLWLWSKEKTDSEFTTGARLKSMQFSIYVNCMLFLAATWVLYNFDYMAALFWGLISIPIFSLMIFYFLLYRTSKKEQHNYSVG